MPVDQVADWGADAISAAVLNAADAPPADERPAPSPKKDKTKLEQCPITPLGVEGEIYWYLDAMRQLRALKPKDHSRLGICSLFGTELNLLKKHWPRLNKDGDVNGFKPEVVAEDLMVACARRGVWNAAERIRGPGAWAGDEGELIMHCGDTILAGKDWHTPGLIGRHVYPAAPGGPRPIEGYVPAGELSPGYELLELLESWSWRRGSTDARLLLGWIGAAIMAAASDWRPMTWITGDSATGKSTLMKAIWLVLGEAIIKAEEPTPAGIWQRIGHASLPVAIDELEAEEDNRRAKALIKLARIAASGGVVLRGGADHQGSSFTARSAFLFSSILVPPLPNQDRNRMAILELDALADGAMPPDITPARMSRIGIALRRRIVQGWPRFTETLELYKRALAKHGHAGRGADQFGTLLAAGDLLLHDDVPDEGTLEDWGSGLAKKDLAEASEDIPDHERCLTHLLTSSLDVYRGGAKRQVGDWIAKAAAPEKTWGEDADDNPDAANRHLATYGLRVLAAHDPARAALAVANSHQGLAQLFRETHWAGRSGTSGVWVQALRRIEGAQALSPVRFNNVPARATAIPLAAILEVKDGASM